MSTTCPTRACHPAAREAVGELVTGAFREIEVAIDLVLQEGELVADSIRAHGIRAKTGEPTDWIENHIYRVVNGRIVELWPAGGPTI